MDDSVDITPQSLSTGKNSVKWNPTLMASGTEETQSSVGAVPQMLFQTSENEVNLQDVVVTVEMSSDPGNISSHFCDKLDEDLYLGRQKRTSEGITESGGCTLQDINIKHPLTEAKKGTKRAARNYHSWSETQMEEAVAAVIYGKCSIYSAAIKYNVPKSSLHSRVRKVREDQRQISQNVEEPESGTSMGVCLDESGEKGVGNELAILCNEVENRRSERMTDSSTDRCNGRKYRWKEEDMVSALNAVESNIMTPKMAASHHGIPFWAILNTLHNKPKTGSTDSVTGMGRKKSRTKWKRWNESDIEKAIAAVNEQGFSIRKAASHYGIPKSSLCDRLHGKRKLKKGASPKEEKVSARLLGDWAITDRQGVSNFESKRRGRRKTMLKSRMKHEKVSRKSLIAANSRSVSPKHNVGDEVQVHVIDEDAIMDGRYDRSFSFRDKEKLGNKRILSGEPPEDDKEYDDFNEEAVIYANGETLLQNDLSNGMEMSHKTKPSIHLKGRITMTDDIIDRKEVLTMTTRSWTQKDMDSAVRDVIDNGFSIRKAAGKYCIPKSSLADRISKEKYMKAVGRLVDELKPLAKTNQDMQRLQKLENGKINPKTIAKRFGLSSTCLRKLAAGNETEICFSDMPGDLVSGVSEDGAGGHGDRMQGSLSKNQQDFCLPDIEANLQAGVDSKARRLRMRWSPDNLEQAIAAVRDGHLSLRGSSRMYGIPKSTLGDILRGKSSVGLSSRGNHLLNDEEEASVAGWLVTMAKAGRHVKVKEVLDTVKAILDKSGRSVPRLKDNLPKGSWWYGFLARHEEVAAIRKQSKAEGKSLPKDIEDINIPARQDAISDPVVYAPDNATVLSPEEQYLVINGDPAYLHPNIAVGPVKGDDEDCLCSICGAASVTGNKGEKWICCGVISTNGIQIEGCGEWSHLKCSNLGQRNLNVEELESISWRCPKCMEL